MKATEKEIREFMERGKFRYEVVVKMFVPIIEKRPWGGAVEEALKKIAKDPGMYLEEVQVQKSQIFEEEEEEE